VTLGGGESGIERGSNVGDSIVREKALRDDGYSKDVSDDDHWMVACGVNEEERLSVAMSLREEGRPASGHGSRPSTRGSR
jgi:uridine phosphorylase